MEKNKIDKKSFLYIVLPPVIESSLYFLVKFLSFRVHVIGSSLDSSIPFVPIFIYPYVIWFFMLVLVPYFIYRYDKRAFADYIKLYLICSSLCILIFICYPTTINRESVVVNGVSTYLVNLIYNYDTPILNCFPSMHALNSLLWIVVFSRNKKIPIIIRLVVIILSISVILSTLFIKQHVIYDLIGAGIVFFIGYIIFEKTKKYVKFKI